VTPEGRDARKVIRSEVLDALWHWLPAKAFPLDEIADDIADNCLDALAPGPGVVALVRGDDGTVTIAGMERRDWWWEDNMPVLSAFAPTVAPDDPSEMPLYRLVDGTDS
jgi:hypothetical protein